MKALKKTVKEISLEEKAKTLNVQMQEALALEQKEIVDTIGKILAEKGYGLSARMILEAGKEMQVQPFIYKLPK